MLGSTWNDSATFDEQAHIPAGFGYLTQLDYRLNPEHPPLIKVLSGLSTWIFARPNFSTDTPYWQSYVNGQWDQGRNFLYESGNNADNIIFWSRFPILLLALLFGWLIFKFTKKRYGSATALLTLIFFSFSPTFIAHSRFVTTDLGAALGFFLGTIFFLKFLENPTWKNIFWAGLIFGIAQLIKFSLIILIPLYVSLLLCWVLTRSNLNFSQRLAVFLQLAGKTITIGAIGFMLVWLVYGVFTWNYPQDKQFNDTETILSTYGSRAPVDLNLALIKNKFTRPFAEYIFGVLMVNQRAAGGNTTYFLGEVSASGSRIYFPLMYLLKESLALHVLTLIAIGLALRKTLRRSKPSFFPLKFSLERIRAWIENNFFEFSSLVFIILYWAISIKTPLNIGVRHLLPTFPFIYMLVAKEISQWLKAHEISNPQNWFGWLKNIYQIYIASIPKYLVVGLLLLWLILNTVTIFPHFLSYYNELAGGTQRGYKIAVDSNYDWGQDLKRLAKYMEEQKVEKISLDYFGGGNPRYYLGERFEPWWSGRGPTHGWFAVSSTLREGSFGKWTHGLMQKPEDSYSWLKPYMPVAQIGYSIFIYKLP